MQAKMNVNTKPVAMAPLANRQVPKASTQKLMKMNKVSNAPEHKQMLVWQPENNKQFELFSYIPPLTDDQIARQVDYIIGQSWIPCLEFANPSEAYIDDETTKRFCGTAATYEDNRYWTMWKLPMFGCRDAGQVLKEVGEAAKCFPEAYVRLLAFDNNRQVQVLSFLVHRPPKETGYCPLDKRSVGIGQ